MFHYRFNQEYQIEDVNHASAQRLLEVAEDIDPHLGNIIVYIHLHVYFFVVLIAYEFN